MHDSGPGEFARAAVVRWSQALTTKNGAAVSRTSAGVIDGLTASGNGEASVSTLR